MTKRHAYYEPELIGRLKLDRDKFTINRTYQREFVWTKKDMQYFIDSIIQDFPIPQVYLRKIPFLRD